MTRDGHAASLYFLYRELVPCDGTSWHAVANEPSLRSRVRRLIAMSDRSLTRRDVVVREAVVASTGSTGDRQSSNSPLGRDSVHHWWQLSVFFETLTAASLMQPG